eukprot:6707793-Pyramimonas_sp.AAC.1
MDDDGDEAEQEAAWRRWLCGLAMSACGVGARGVRQRADHSAILKASFRAESILERILVERSRQYSAHPL